MNTAVVAFIKTTYLHLFYSEKPQLCGSQLQAQLQQRRLENEEAAAESVGFDVKGFCCRAGQSQTQTAAL